MKEKEPRKIIPFPVREFDTSRLNPAPTDLERDVEEIYPRPRAKVTSSLEFTWRRLQKQRNERE